MDKTIAQYPYDDFYLYIVYHKKEDRKYAVLYPIDGKSSKRTTISYARYLMSVKEGRKLLPSEEVDHIDNDKTNDDINNLQILSPSENKIKYSKQLSHVIVRLKCPWCGKILDKPRNKTYLVKGNSFSACSRSCATKFAYKMVHEPNSATVMQALEENYVLEYRENYSV